jgi:hypothetical protein
MTAAQAAQLGLALQGLQGLSGGNANLLRQLYVCIGGCTDFIRAAVSTAQSYGRPQPAYAVGPVPNGFVSNGSQPPLQPYQSAYPARPPQPFATRPAQPYIQQLQQQSQFGFAPFS